MIPMTPPILITISLGEWTRIRGNERQRNTERHADKVEHQFKVVLPQHWVVYAAQLPSGEYVKLDGHTRCLLWNEGRAPKPAHISMMVHQAADEEHVKTMYDAYDGSKSAETSADRVFGAFREHGIHPQSKLLQRGTLTSALALVESARTGVSRHGAGLKANSAVIEWKDEINCLDRIITGHESRRMHSSIAAAMMLTVRRRGFHVVAPFWARYLAKKEEGDVRDPHNLLLSYLRRCQAMKWTGSSTSQLDIAGKALSACENGIAGVQRTRLQGYSVLKYLKMTDAQLPKRPVSVIPISAHNEDRVSL